MGAPLTMSSKVPSQKSGLATSENATDHDDFQLAGEPQDPMARLARVVENLESKVDQGFREVRAQFATYKPVDAEDMKAFDTLPDEAQLDVRKEARYLAEDINWAAEMRADPLFAFHYWRYNYFIPGLGMFTEGYVLFSNGNLKTLYQKTWPECWSKYQVCNKSWVDSVDYLQISGILVGQFVMGFFADSLGRRTVQIFDAFVMTIGVILLTAVSSPSLNGFVIALSWSFFVYGVGVGGEYPTTSSIAAEKAESSPKLLKRRGRTVLLTFAMQGWGQVINVGSLLILLLMFNSTGNPPYSAAATGATYRVSYALMLPFLVVLCYWRVFRMRENAKYKRVTDELNHAGPEGEKPVAAAPNAKQGYDWHNLRLMGRFFWPRMIASMFGWFLNDFGFYGSKVFIGNFVSIIAGANAGVQTTWLWTLLQTGVQMFGYYAAAYTIDSRVYGRRRMQMIGFMVLFLCYLMCAIFYDQLTEQQNIQWYQLIFFIQAFFQQFGPNCTTFLVAAEIYPSPIRATGHGMSAASGKLGALVPEIIFNYVASRTRFWVTTWFNLAGFIATFLFLPEVTGLDLSELDRWWYHIKRGEVNGYHGLAVSPQHLSPMERWVMKYDKNFDLAKDADERVEEMHNVGNGLGLSMSFARHASGISDFDHQSSEHVLDKLGSSLRHRGKGGKSAHAATISEAVEGDTSSDSAAEAKNGKDVNV